MSTPMLALGTTFDRRTTLAPEAIIERAVTLLTRAGISDSEAALVLDAHLDEERLDALVPLFERRRELRVVALEGGSGLLGRAALASLDKEEARAAVGAAEATLRRASALGAGYVVLRLGWVEGARRDWIYARDQFLRGALVAPKARALQGARDRAAVPHLDRVRGALERVCRLADSLGVKLLLKNGQRYVELPSPPELERLRDDLRGAPLAGLFDLPAAHLVDAMGMFPLAAVQASFAADKHLSYLGDACGAVAALPAGHGELGRARVRAIMTECAAEARVFRPWAGLEDEEIVLGLSSLRA